jgi:hypothetical protein
MLSQEEQRDDAFRARYAGQYEGTPSASLCADLKKVTGHLL